MIYDRMNDGKHDIPFKRNDVVMMILQLWLESILYNHGQAM